MRQFFRDVWPLLVSPTKVRNERAARESEVECAYQEAIQSIIGLDDFRKENIATTILLNEALAGKTLN